MEAMNINNIGGNNSNFRLRGEPVKLATKVLVGCKPDGDGWEEVWDESIDFERYRPQIRFRGSRKQKAARMIVPFNTVKVVPKLEVGAPPVVVARLEGKSEAEVRIMELEWKIKQLMGLAQ